jgi:dipeptidyl aminopeptidase/acylaminoacyl peptidase
MRRHSFIKITLLVLLLGTHPGCQTLTQAADAPRPLQVDDYFAMKGVGNPLISPDGNWVLYSVYTKDLENDRSDSHLWMVPTAGGEARPITTKGWGHSWTPDSQHLTFTARSKDQGSQIFKLDLYGSGERVQMTHIKGGIGSHRWSPDRKRLLLSIRDKNTDAPTIPWVIDDLIFKQDYVGYIKHRPTHLYVLILETETTIYAMLEDDGRVDLVAVSVADGALTRLIKGKVRVEDIAVAPNGSLVVSMSMPRLPGELFVLDPESSKPQPRRLTDVNGDLLNSIWLSEVEELRFPTLDGTEIQTFVYKPQEFNPKRKYPAILWLHGGQESQYDYGFNFRVQLFAAQGYVVVMPNVRGSGGRGLDFGLALNKACGTKDVEDVIVATDYVIKQGYVDPGRLGIGGWLSGGTLANFVIAKTQRFAGAISGASVGWYTSTYGHDPYYLWWHKELGAPWKNRDLWDRVSPFIYVENITTPTLFIGGEKDWNQPMKHLGREAQLVVYPNAHHGIRKHSYQKDLLERFLGWFDKYVKGSSSD